MNKSYNNLEEGCSEEFHIAFPQASAQSNNLLIHSPSEIWGYDEKRLILGVVASCHMEANVWYVWYRDGIKIKEGNKNCCLPITSQGTYVVEVCCGEVKETSMPVFVSSPSELEPTVSKTNSTAATVSVPQLPVVDKQEINFSVKDEIGRGSYGVVYRGKWAGTDVAVKHVRIRNAKRLRLVMETEVRFHSMVRHPNIIQLMAVSYLKNSVYIVSELIKGRNLEDLLFNDGEESFQLKAAIGLM